jgi:hypothetical protein
MERDAEFSGSPHDQRVEPVSPEDSALIDAVVNAHIGVPLKEHHALTLLVSLGMNGDEAEDLLSDARHEASKL